MNADWQGPDSEEIFSELVLLYGNRLVVRVIRALLCGDTETVRSLCSQTVGLSNQCLLSPHDARECSRVNAMENEKLVSPLLEPSGYEEPDQFTSGDASHPNECFPTGEVEEPECGLDALFWTPLLWASRAGLVDMCRVLVKECDANREYISPAGCSALLAALKTQCPLEDCAAIIALVATPSTINPPKDVQSLPPDDSMRISSWPILCALSDEGHDGPAVFQALLDAGSLIPPELPDQLEEWGLPQSVVDVLMHAANASNANAACGETEAKHGKRKRETS